MSIDQVDVFQNIQSSFQGKESFRVAVGRALDQINTEVTNISTPPLATAVFDTLSRVDFSTIAPGGYVTVLAAVAGRRFIEVINRTDQPMIVSFDGGTTDHWYLGIAEGRTWELARDGLDQDAAIAVKHDGVAPTTGEVHGQGYR